MKVGNIFRLVIFFIIRLTDWFSVDLNEELAYLACFAHTIHLLNYFASPKGLQLTNCGLFYLTGDHFSTLPMWSVFLPS